MHALTGPGPGVARGRGADVLPGGAAAAAQLPAGPQQPGRHPDRAGRAAEAAQMLQAAIAAAPDYAEAYNNLGVLQRELGAIEVRLLA